jgi:biopolymer transport protein ExbB/TolQ
MLDACSSSWQSNGCEWSIGYLWRSMDWLGRGDVALLALMLLNAVVIICHRFYRYSTARRQSRAFVHDAAAALRDGRFDEVITIAARQRRSHVATVVAAGLNAFASAPPQFSDVEAIDAAERAFQRRRRMLTADLKLGLNTLASIASSAPFIGLFGTVFGILGAFREVGMQRDAAMAMITSSLAEALVTTAMGLLVAVPAVWWHNYLRSHMEVLESEMSNAALEAATYLNTHPEWRNRREYSATEATSLDFSMPFVSAARSWEAPYDRQRGLLLAMWLAATLFIAFICARGLYWS